VEKREFYTEDNYFKKHIENIGKNFIIGYNAALLENDTKKVFKTISENTQAKYSGFCYEGAAMAFVINDFFNPFKSSFNNFLEVCNKHEYMLYIGAGWAVCKLPFKRLLISKLNNGILHKLVFDGIGFYHGYFDWKNTVSNKKIPNYIKESERDFYYQGLGRSFWFIFGGNAKKISEAINQFSSDIKPNLWSGIGLSSTYAGGRQDSILDLKKLSKNYFPNLAQGCTFAAKARRRADNITMHNRYACNLYCEMSVEDCAKLTDECLNNLDKHDYESWRKEVINFFK